MSIYNLAIVGAGQLGSRHLQGLSTSKNIFNIYVVDPSQESLKTAKARLEEVNNTFFDQIFFCQSIIELPEIVDLAIIATLADVRCSIIKLLISEKIVKNLIIEKIVFQRPDDFHGILPLLKQKNVNAWVNCVRRSYPVYKSMKNKMKVGHPVKITASGFDWGMACNGIHFIDLLFFLGGDEKEFLYNTSNLIKKVYDSKRNGFLEIRGKLTIESNLGDELILIDSEECQHSPFKVTIGFGETVFDIDESAELMNVVIEEKKYIEKIKIPFQSELTGHIVDQILAMGKSDLTTIDECALYHVPMLKAFNDHFTNVLKKEVEVCPIS